MTIRVEGKEISKEAYHVGIVCLPITKGKGMAVEIAEMRARIDACYRHLKTGIGFSNDVCPRFIVHFDAGNGNTLELRGTQGAKLSWNLGKALTHTGKKHWEITLKKPELPFEYKLTLVKQDGSVHWEEIPHHGNRTFTAESHQLQVITPVFKV